MNAEPELQPQPLENWRLMVTGAVMVLVLLAFVARLFVLQVVEHGKWLAAANQNRVEELNIPAPRGAIYDRRGIVLARNVASYNLIITPAYLPDDPGKVDEIFQELSRLTGVPVSHGVVDKEHPYVACRSDQGIRQIVNFGETFAPYRPVKIKCNIPRKVAMIIRERASDWPGVGIEVEPIRDYPTGYLTAHIVGFLGPVPKALVDYYKKKGLVPNRDKVGYAGVELSHQDLLAGKNGHRVVEVDVAGHIIGDLKPPQPPIPGKNLVLTIDTRLQDAAYHILAKQIQYINQRYPMADGEPRTHAGVVIAMNPKTGEILAMVSYPTYENNRMARFIPAYYYKQLAADPEQPLLNHAISGEYAPGSTFKIVTGTGAINEHVVSLDQIIDAPGIITLANKYYANDPGKAEKFYDHNYKQGGFGKIDFLHCIAYSSNVCFYKLGGGYDDEIKPGLGICRLGTYAHALGYGARTGIDLPGEATGLIPSPTWKRIYKGENWSTGDTYLASVGQGYVLGTPLQVLMSAATIANNGRQMQPTVLREVVDAEGKVIQPFRPKVRWDITKDPLIKVFYNPAGIGRCKPTGELKTVDPWSIKQVQRGMRLAVTDGTHGTLHRVFEGFPIPVAGKTGTAEYCDNKAQQRHLCRRGDWPDHGWTVAYAPYNDPEIVVVAFIYNGGEGAVVAGPVVRRVMEAYFALKAADAARRSTSPKP